MLPYQPEEIVTEIHQDNLRWAEHVGLIKLAQARNGPSTLQTATDRIRAWLGTFGRDRGRNAAEPMMEMHACPEC